MEPLPHPSQTPPAQPLRRAPTISRGRWLLAAAMLVAALGAGWSIKRATAPASRVETIGYTDLVTRCGAGEVVRADIENDRISLRLKNGGTAVAVVGNAHSQHAIVSMLAERGVDVSFQPRDTAGERALGALTPLVVLLSFVTGAAIVYRRRRLSHVRHVQPVDPSTAVSFRDVAGVDEAKQGLE